MSQGIALIASDVFMKMTGSVLGEMFPSKGD